MALGVVPAQTQARIWGRVRQLWRTYRELPDGELPMVLNSLALILGKFSSMGLGFLTWLLAARLFVASEVGLASGAVSAITLCVQIALLGIGSAVIALFPQNQDRPALLLNTAITLVAGTALVTACLFLVLASRAFQELSVVGAIPLYALAFVAMGVTGTVGVLFDQTSTILRRGDHVLIRGILSGGATLIGLALLRFVTGSAGSLAIFSAWALGSFSLCLLGAIQLWRSSSRYRYRVQMERGMARQLLGVGLPNWALTVAERIPGPLMSIVVTELLSPADNAYWYAVWMMAWLVFIVPIQVGINQFAEAAHDPKGLIQIINQGIRSSLAFGSLAAVGLAVIAPILLSFLGADYAAAGTTPLRILVVTVLPLSFVQAYFAACRATRRLREAVTVSIVNALASVGGAVIIGVAYGLTGMALAWLVAQAVTGAWGAWRLQSLSKGEATASV